MDNNEIDVDKYQNALSDLCGVDYSYMLGDSAVNAIAELIALAVEQEVIIKRQQAEIESYETGERILICQLAEEREKAIKEFAERLIARAEKAYYSDTYMCVDIYDITKLEEEMVGAGQFD